MPIEIGGGWQILANLYFYQLSVEKIVLKWKLVNNLKTNRNSSKAIDISNITIELDTRDGILLIINWKRFSDV